MRSEQDYRELSLMLLGACRVDTSVPEWKAAEAGGWDMSLVRDALRGDVLRRAEQHQSALDLAESLRAAYVEQYGQPSSPA